LKEEETEGEKKRKINEINLPVDEH